MKTPKLVAALILYSAVVVAAESPNLPVKVGVFAQEMRTFYNTKQGLPSDDVRSLAIGDAGVVFARTAAGDVAFRGGVWEPASDVGELFGHSATRLAHQTTSVTGRILSIARKSEDAYVIGAERGLFARPRNSEQLQKVFPRDANRSWAPTQVFVDYDGLGRLWFASQQGVGCLQDGTWVLYTGADGLPYDDCTAMVGGADGTVWIGTKMGAIRFDGAAWCYRQGQRWLPHDEVRDIVVDSDGNAWIATAAGISHISFKKMTLAEKAKHYESEIDARHRRTEFGYVIQGYAGVAGEKSSLDLSDSDNDGLWTSMYGAGECFAYAATKDPQARHRAKAAFRALRFLSEAPQGSRHAPPPGFIARTVLETSSAKNPNAGPYTLDGQRRQQASDRSWRVYEPRWPKSADGRYYWKSDTSSDELDGHYFFYSLYYDLVADSRQEKAVVRDVVRANIDHLIQHDFSLYDHAGRTRWGVYDPQEINHNPDWIDERGLNSVSILSYLNVAFHITGDQRYRDVAKGLRDKHAYHINTMIPKIQRGIGTGNQSDDEMAFMSFYNLIRYEPDPNLKRLYTNSFAKYWRLEEPEMNPFFNFCFAAVAKDTKTTDRSGTHDLSPRPAWLSDSIDTLQRFPLDRFDWRHTNQHRKDLVMLRPAAGSARRATQQGRGHRYNGKVIPVDERYFNHWNHDPWRLDMGGEGRTLGTGAVFTLPYYMGLYHGFIQPDP